MSATQPSVRLQAPCAYADRVTAVLTAAGLRVSPRAEVGLLVTASDDPTLTDPWLVDSLPHLVVRLREDAGIVGPFVDPGRTACLRCVAMASPRRTPDEPSHTGPPIPPPSLLAMAVARAAHELVAWHEDRLPLTWSSTLTTTSGTVATVDRWLRHPHCSCSWGLAAFAG